MKSEEIELKRKAFCRQLFDISQQKGITADEIAEKTGFRPGNVVNVFNGRYNPTLDVIIAIADVLGVDVTVK